MFDFGRMIELASDRFPPHPRDGELVNGGHGFALAEFLASALAQHGLTVRTLAAEDWGWYAEVDNPDFPLAFGCTSFGARDFLIQFMPDKPVIRRLFRKIETRAATQRLAGAVFDILSADGVALRGPAWVDKVSATLGDDPVD
ncbi:MAG: hypothetical protein C0500_02830 [Sphingobium sp.]|jgi:hypothetical protein|nr:hypothetical protein [Sphingobium sp.]